MGVNTQKTKFIAVGVLNTVLDFTLFLLLSHIVNPVVANYISTTTCLLISFMLNRSYTFNAAEGNLRTQFILFIVFTGIALWILQPICIAGSIHALRQVNSLTNLLVLAAAKAVATVVSLLWNYVTYSRYVFKKSTTSL